MKIAVDAMGGDHAPAEIIKGSVQAAREYGLEILLVGTEELVNSHLRNEDMAGLKIQVVPASEVIAFDEPPVAALRKKKDSTTVVGLKLVKDGGADAFVSAGSTGALLAGGLLLVGRIKGVDRPALGTVMPTTTGATFVLDVGANMNSRPHNLHQFAVMGSIYAERVLKMKEPRVALLNVGTEETKGDEVARAAYQLLKTSGLNFAGNVEGRDVLFGAADVVVADGFAGNIFLKAIEGAAAALFGLIKAELTSSLPAKAAAVILKPRLKAVARRLDYAEYGGGPFLGVDGTVVKCHGSSKALAIKNGIRVARDFLANDCVRLIRDNIPTEDGAKD